ncbi:hypothetical protein METSMIALI_00548 [Methanobrevibacter smithii DSM 2375]|jgi:uncharacterized protein YuzE|uniref:DUF2283 domain-containing protein n=2 Tax=Methanobrevibacter smithii TaxID=2173 RepID=B9ADX2_METSM|nr:DUF2283 domain-containing protein [Methanobrevibacter smithii]EEE41662.1 hypothetical protein METSMIALI_00548 [Methanobrevibacter smithii DSM 2375]
MYDYSSDVLGVKVKNDFIYHETVELEDGVLLDFDKNDVPVSLEIMDASKRFNIPKSSLNDLKFFNMTVVVDNKFITINVVIGVLIHNNENKQILESFTVNKYGIPNITADLTI